MDSCCRQEDLGHQKIANKVGWSICSKNRVSHNESRRPAGRRAAAQLVPQSGVPQLHTRKKWHGKIKTSNNLYPVKDVMFWGASEGVPENQDCFGLKPECAVRSHSMLQLLPSHRTSTEITVLRK